MRASIGRLICVAALGWETSVVLAGGQFADFIMEETWVGLEGAVLVDGQQTKLPALLWELVIPQQRRLRVVAPLHLDPRDRRKYPTARPKPAEWLVVDEVLLRVRGGEVQFQHRPRRTNLIASEFDGLLLSVGEHPRSDPLTLLKKPTAASSWKVRKGQQTIWRKDHGRDGFQFEVTAEAQWKLESSLHPGWFLGLQGETLVLVGNIDDAAVIVLTQQRFFDDLTDGK